MPKILFVTNDSWFFESHRLAIAKYVATNGFETHLAAKPDQSTQSIVDSGVNFHSWNIDPRGTSPVGEMRTFFNLAQIVRRVKPDIIHLITIKPVLYGGIISRILRVPGVVYAVNGLGTVFVGSSRKARFLKQLIKRVYSAALGHRNSVVIFQNGSDRNKLFEIIQSSSFETVLVRGSGVDLDKYVVKPLPNGIPVVCMAARLLRDKGVFEFVQAAEKLHKKGVRAEFWLAGGAVAQGNPASLTDSEISFLKSHPNVKMLGNRDDIPDLFAKSTLVVLPSWREGLPKVLVEAAACGRAVVTTDVPGCRDAITPNVTGLLVPVQDPNSLADTIQSLLQNSEQLVQLGIAGRELAETSFDIDKIVDEHFCVYNRLLYDMRE